jgi:isopropylmalate/homocitrate/citramalate synthase
MLTRASKVVATATSFPVQYNKAIVGRNAFAHESGIHQDGMIKHSQTYEIMTPESVGVLKTSLVMGKHSGRCRLPLEAEEMGYRLSDNQFEDAFVRFKDSPTARSTSMTRTSRRWSTSASPPPTTASASSRSRSSPARAARSARRCGSISRAAP